MNINASIMRSRPDLERSQLKSVMKNSNLRRKKPAKRSSRRGKAG